MTEVNIGGETRVGSVKAAINMYGQRAFRNSSAQVDSTAPKSSSAAENLHKSRRQLGIYSESKKAAESLITKAEAELSNVKNTVKELTLSIEKSNCNAKSDKRDMEALKKSRIQKEVDDDDDMYVEVMRELEAVKQELSKLKLDVASVVGQKSAAEKEILDWGLKMEVNLKLVESLTNEIEVANEEQVLVELAKIEALQEYKEIEDQREEKNKEFLVSLEERKKKIKEMMEEVERSKEIENELSVTLSDVEMLEIQLKLVKEMERKVRRSDSLSRSRRSFKREKDNLSVLKELTEEMEAKKEELSSINAEVFQLMSVMDALRNELIQAKEETARFEKIVQKDDSKIEKFNSKLLRAKSKLETVSAAEERTSSLGVNLTGSLEKLMADNEAAKKEELILKEETGLVKAEIHKAELEIEEKEKELLAKLNELEKVKEAEALALEKLESMIENTMEARGSVSQQGSTITISRFEYEYLTGHASQAEETAEKKVAAAEAWVEALKASTRAITMKTETFKRASGVTRTEEEREAFRAQRSLSKKRMVEQEIENLKQNPDGESFLNAKPVRKSTRLSGKYTPTQRGKPRRLSMANRGTPTFFIIKKKKKVPNLVKFFKMKR
ncbi:PREDICTED: protein PLASTID MOVEMENT IMPAIRED 2 [Tarenaya hassleriana]|uniref:protein PLASTID MOVEMENT IMPAIRED 2 n=1 Tax=Tarenaya hassleriana TaxID=28532 RepID=UPI00053C67D0|nr:PREDICTED: protein PLASTID MOVEMENT IMPAIRED 2 [Tarenaya hassleriana]XP_010553904.1 PREDICTED: protein PLASTID MOVEMENT IMPAIRED 2 [Tarenaya hassleriana]